MGFNIFGYTITKDKDNKHEDKFIPSVVTPSNTDGSITVSTNVGNSGLMSGYYSYQFDVDGALRNESQMISQYRATASYPDVDTAIETIVNEAVIVEQGEPPVSINTDNLPEQYSVVKQQINDCFQRVLDVLDFNNNCHDIFKRWYIDGKLYYFVIIDPKNPKKGIIDLKYIDPRKIRKVVEYQKQNKDGIDVVVGKNEYYLFNDNGLTENGKGIKISTDSIINVGSGLIDANTGNGISYLFKAIKPTNQLKMMEDSLVIYRITRAPERRVFYVDVGKLPGPRAEQYVRQIMNKFRNKVVYDVATGEVRNTKNYQSMCLSMDTKVSLLDGRELSIREIAKELQLGKQLWTYSCDPVTGKVVPGKIDWAGVTQKSAKVIKVNLDNGESVVCTPDHKFPIKGVGFIRADQLKANDSLIPLYRRKTRIDTAYKNTYEQYFDNKDCKWYFTHRKVVDYTQQSSNFTNKRVIHHIDLNRYNNNPDNLKQMDWQEHRALHNQIGFLYKEKMVSEGHLDEWRDWKSNIGLNVWNNKSEADKKAWIDNIQNAKNEYYTKIKQNNQWDDFCQKFVHCGKKAQQTRKVLMQDEQWVKQFHENCKRAQNVSEVRAKNLLRAQKQTIVIDDLIAQFVLDFINKHRNGSRTSIGKLIDALNNNASMVDHLNTLNCNLNGRFSGKFTNKSLKKALLKYTNFETWNALIESMPNNNNHIAKINDDVAKYIVDLYKSTNGVITVKALIDNLNSNSAIIDIMHNINKDAYYRFDHFNESNIKTLVCRFYGFDSFSDFKLNYQYLNHRVVSIENIEEPMEVGCLTIDKNHQYHNYHTFALTSGVFCKNCEDYWLPRREGGKATEIQTLPAAQSLGELDDVVYFRNKLYQSMNVPRQRLQSDNLASIGNNNEITREEVAFSKFIQKLRNRFNVLFKEALRIQLIVSKVISQKDWESIRNNIYFEYQHDNYFEEIKRIEIFNQKVAQLATVDGYKGVYFSKQYIVDKVLGFNQDQWNEIQQQIKQEQIDEAVAAAQLEQKTAELQNQGNDVEQGVDDQGGDDQYNDFVNDETSDQDQSENETELTDQPEQEQPQQQSDDTTDTINDNQTPNPGEDDFTRPSEQGLKVAG